MEIEKEFDVDVYDISKVISEEEMKELCEDGYGLDNVLNLFTPDEILDNIETSDIVANVARRPDFDWISFASIGDIDKVIEWLESYGFEVTENK